MRYFAQETGVSKLSAALAMKLLKLWPQKATVIHALQPCDSASMKHFSSWVLQSVYDSDVDPCFPQNNRPGVLLIHKVNFDLFKRHRECGRVQGHYFQHLLQNI